MSEGGLAAAVAEMAFAGGLGAKIDLGGLSQFLQSKNGTVPFDAPGGCPDFCEEKMGLSPSATVLLFSESNTRFLCEVTPENATAFEKALDGIACAKIGEVVAGSTLEISLEKPLITADIAELKEAWQKPLRW
jgi:phosphoribosylformylglycinamidine synthase subunit PurSL